MRIAAPLMPLPVVLPALPEAPITTGGVALQLPLLGRLLPGTLPAPVLAWPCWLVLPRTSIWKPPSPARIPDCSVTLA